MRGTHEEEMYSLLTNMDLVAHHQKIFSKVGKLVDEATEIIDFDIIGKPMFGQLEAKNAKQCLEGAMRAITESIANKSPLMQKEK